MDMEALQRIFKNISNNIIDMKKNIGHGISNAKKLFKFAPKKITPPPTTKTTPPTKGTNVEDFIKAFKSWENALTQNKRKKKGERRNKIPVPRCDASITGYSSSWIFFFLDRIR
jgi:hypothetical protein